VYTAKKITTFQKEFLYMALMRKLLAETTKVLSVHLNSNSHGARPDHLIITIIKWIRTSRLSIKKSLSGLADLVIPPPLES